TGQVKDERIYLGGFEIYRKNGANPLVRETLHIIDDKQPIALVETRTQGGDSAQQKVIRYQFGNHLGSAGLELDDQAQIISYEEYTPYGSTSYQAVRNHTETPKRYRYTGKERDEESGLYYHGARYYGSWLGRWVSTDRQGIIDSLNVYSFVKGNPLILIDSTGHDSKPSAFPPFPGLKGAYEEIDRMRIEEEHKIIETTAQGFSEVKPQVKGGSVRKELFQSLKTLTGAKVESGFDLGKASIKFNPYGRYDPVSVEAYAKGPSARLEAGFSGGFYAGASGSVASVGLGLSGCFGACVSFKLELKLGESGGFKFNMREYKGYFGPLEVSAEVRAKTEERPSTVLFVKLERIKAQK